MAKKHMKKCSTPLAIKEIPLHSCENVYHHNSNKYWQGCGEKEPSHAIGGNVN
jgi:hypothetical protein